MTRRTQFCTVLYLHLLHTLHARDRFMTSNNKHSTITANNKTAEPTYDKNNACTIHRDLFRKPKGH